ncbi:hypothetical protein GQ53DRAFT_744995 [Thozetella sp. PMI_491]|nr:hypothetical protein GQ53DRAFT_744995 [Thozetella sp. PMI_491]
MPSFSLKTLLWGTAVSSLAAQVAASPVVGPRSLYAEHALNKRANLVVRQTTTTDDNTIDWIPIESQGEIAAAPPTRSLKNAKLAAESNATKPVSELMKPDAQLGPPGTVPIPRVSLDYLNNVAEKQLPDIGTADSKAKSKRQNANKHWYVSSNQNVGNIGGLATYSLYKAYVANNGDFSLLQTAVTKQGTNGGQTLEAGWINYPNQVSAPHLFTFYTTNGYATQADYQGGWNQDVKGWVQVDTVIFPGTVFAPNSVDGGTQYEMEIEYYLYQGNWWLWVLDRWIGYYPASLFSNGISGVTLATGSDVILYYGEIYQNEDPLTTTDMGSGNWGTSGFGHSAYIRKMYWTDSSATLRDYTATFGDSDSNRYNHQNTISSGADWGSYVFLGGPGAGGVIGG